jgi:NAD(P)H-dependent flavin oxidoreductase YrpB (nitropropane dioxygenase family)
MARSKSTFGSPIAAGADVIVAQGMEAGGHRGSFDAERSDTALIGLFALLPAVVDAIGDRIPVVATGGIADVRGIAAALLLGASAVQIGTGLLRTPRNSHRLGPTLSPRRNPRTPLPRAPFWPARP